MPVRVQGFARCQQREQCDLLLLWVHSRTPGLWGGTLPPLSGSRVTASFLAATAPYLLNSHLIAPSIIFPICRVGTVIPGTQGAESINECFEAHLDL